MERVLKERTFSGTQDPEVTERELKNRKIARKAAAQGIVLLKNENQVLPLKKGTAVSLYGTGASKTVKGGTGSGDVNERESISIYSGMKAAGYLISNEEWIKNYDIKYEKARNAWRDEILLKIEGKGEKAEDFFEVYSSIPFVMPAGSAVIKAESDTAIYILSRVAGENADRHAKSGDYFLSNEEQQMLADICQLYQTVIVAINTGGMVDLSFLEKFHNIKGLLQIVQPGMEGGNAFADVVSGDVTPSGKLADSWAFQYDDYPNAAKYSHNNGNVKTETYEEGIYVGYRYFDSFGIPVRYCFGFGLSYTTFDYSVTDIRVADEQVAEIKVIVKNTGEVKGKEVIQLYISCPNGKLEKEYRRLVAYQKTRELKPGESQELSLIIPIQQMTSYDEGEPGWILEEGIYRLWLGNSLAAAKLCGGIVLEQKLVLVKTENICLLEEKLKEFHQNKTICSEREQMDIIKLKEQKLPTVLMDISSLYTKVIIYHENKKITDPLAKEFTETLSNEELIHLAMGDPGKAQGGNLGAAGISVPGSAGETHQCAIEKGLASIVLADGPAGLRLMKYYNVKSNKIVSMPFQFSVEGGIFCPEADDLPGERYYQYCTAIPVGTLLAQTWDIELLEEVGQMIGEEMQYFGVTLWLAPGMNIHRNPLCGRNFEYYSEDPILTGTIAAAVTNGVQKVPGCGTTIKHFACNNQEDNRMESNSVLSERVLREIYLKGFEIAIQSSQPMSMMTSYNLVNGVHAANSYDLCTKAARNEWGFKGFIMTDWTTTEQDETCTAAGCMRAGNDLVMPGNFCDRDNLKKELLEGVLNVEDLKACIARLVHIIWQSNQYENAIPYQEKKI